MKGWANRASALVALCAYLGWGSGGGGGGGSGGAGGGGAFSEAWFRRDSDMRRSDRDLKIQ
jgi:hypothetical protein